MGARRRRTSSSAACPSRSSTDFWTRVTAFTTAVGSQVSSVSSPPLPPRPTMSTSWYTRSADSPRPRSRKLGLNGLERRDQPAAADPRSRDGTRPMIEMAIVGLGSWGLCVMERTVRRAWRVRTPVRVHLVEPSQLGGGVYAAEQPDFLVLNNACGQLSLYAAPDGDALAPYAVGLHPWAVVRGYRWVGHECRIGTGGDPILPTDYLPRRLMGEYLVWFYDTLVAYAPPNLEIVRHYAAAVDISPALGARESVLLDNGTTLTVDHVVLTSGHTWNDEPGAGGGAHYLRPYPIECLDQSAPAGSSVAVAGMGLVCFDVLTALTIGRGGTFED